MKIKGLRWYIAFLLCLASALNYLDRQTLSVLIGTIKEELHLTNASYGEINAWFLASYGVMYAVSGRIMDYIGTRRGFMLFVSGWSLANMLHVLAASVGQFSFFRFLLGVFEPGSFTGGVKAVGEWFPMRDRALAIGIFNAGTALGSVAAAPIVSVIAMHWGWKAAFFTTGALGFVWLVPWMLFFKQPANHPLLSEEERHLILDGQSEEPEKVRPPKFAQLLRMRETWGCVLVRALTDPISYFLLFWIPLYFQKQYHFDLQKIGDVPLDSLRGGGVGQPLRRAHPALAHRARLGAGPGAQGHDDPDDRHAAGLPLFRDADRLSPVGLAAGGRDDVLPRRLEQHHASGGGVPEKRDCHRDRPGRRARLLDGRTGDADDGPRGGRLRFHAGLHRLRRALPHSPCCWSMC